MKKLLISVILSTSLIFSTPTFSQIALTNPTFEVPKDIIKHKLFNMFKKPITKGTILRGAEFFVINKFKYVIAGGTVLTGVVAYNYLINHPEKMSEFFAVHPTLLEEFSKYVDYRIANAKTQKDYDTFENVKQKLALDQELNQEQTIAIENDPIYIEIEAEVRKEVEITISSIDEQNKQNKKKECTREDLEKLLIDKKIFKNTINPTLPSIEHKPAKILDVGSYKNMTDNYDPDLTSEKIISDHIPSYAALAKYLSSYQLPIPTIRRNNNLENNASTIMIPDKIHTKGSRTFGGRNFKVKITDDSQNLKEATILDIATIAYLLYINNEYNINVKDYIKNSMVLVKRNKELCLYNNIN